ncbi:MAG TPA: hypothetical protein VJ724_06215 [Tahibacter sp.]|nr:hypothetical protein [Tahibacter sp.]
MTVDRFLRPLAAAVLAGAGAAHAATVCRSNANLGVPADGEGLYVNFATGVSGRTESQAPGFDLDVYAMQVSNPDGQMKFYWGPVSNPGAGVVTSGDTYAVLAEGDTVGPMSTFSRAAALGVTTAWQAGVTGFLGARFRNEAAGNALHYGWVHLATTAPLGFPATILDWCYEDTGNAIMIALPDALFANGFEAATP